MSGRVTRREVTVSLATGGAASGPLVVPEMRYTVANALDAIDW